MLLAVQLFTAPQSVCFLQGQTAFWHRKQIRLHVVCAAGTDLYRLARQEGFTYSIVPFRRSVHLFWDAWCLLVLIRLFRQLHPDVVHTNTPKASLLGLLAAWLTGVPVRVYEVHGFVFESRSGLKRIFLIGAERLMGSLATHLLFVSHSLAELADRAGIGQTKAVCVPNHGSCNGVDARNRFNPERFPLRHKRSHVPKELVIGYVGRLSAEKGLQVLTDLWQLLRNDPAVSLLVVGPADSTSAADLACIQQLASDPGVYLTGFVADTAPYLARMDVLVSPTRREGFGNVLIEAAAMGIPVVASRVTGVVDAVHDQQTGMLIDPDSVDLFSEAIRTYLTNPVLRQQHGQAGRHRVLCDFVPEDVWEAKYRFYAHSVTSPVLSA
ncbi:glycosyltransferase family 4 protein [Arsenicibacter rosenii]|uniref:Glycosyltransferase subfamily 4-like N-terminal domain-containing protein n=1 Tax=Arsenicibacter rosenii TaxID=1750698 RepID=A0A1S2VR61_9BACT|nr:glycosyltransferase family 4 protein [Arsenicibacter rosenii]OIN60278.1 hypothetical protein BLX24_05455 [Arsenicibacter rosenii]